MPVVTVNVVAPTEVMNSFAGRPVPLTDMPIVRPAVEATVMILLPAVVTAPVRVRLTGERGTVKEVVPFTAVMV